MAFARPISRAINLTSIGSGSFSFTETGFLPIASFDPGNFAPTGLNGTAEAIAYGLYIAFTASGLLSTIAPNTPQGSFSSINYTLKGDPGFNDTFSHFSVQHQVFCNGCAGDIILASCTLFPGGTNSAMIVNANSSEPGNQAVDA